MRNIEIHTDPSVEKVFQEYPLKVRLKLMYLRSLILETADSIEGLSMIEETLKWGEPSYLVKWGSTIRIDWKERNPHQYAMYLNAQAS